MMAKIFWKVGVRGDYRKPFWRFAWSQLKRGEIENFIAVALIAHHLITFAREAARGYQNASNYSIRLREASMAAE
jgi:hypothetical protein